MPSNTLMFFSRVIHNSRIRRISSGVRVYWTNQRVAWALLPAMMLRLLHLFDCFAATLVSASVSAKPSDSQMHWPSQSEYRLSPFPCATPLHCAIVLWCFIGTQVVVCLQIASVAFSHGRYNSQEPGVSAQNRLVFWCTTQWTNPLSYLNTRQGDGCLSNPSTKANAHY
jgi:hypothetical protein